MDEFRDEFSGFGPVEIDSREIPLMRSGYVHHKLLDVARDVGNKLSQWDRAGAGMVGHWDLKLCNTSVCQCAFLKLMGISKGRLLKHKRAVDSGMRVPPSDGRSTGAGAAARLPKSHAAMSYFQYVYEYQAEHLAEFDKKGGNAEDDEEDLEDEEEPTAPLDTKIDDNPVARACAADKHDLPPKWIENVKFAQLYDEYCFWHRCQMEGGPVSTSCFREVWKKHWRGVIRTGSASHHEPRFVDRFLAHRAREYTCWVSSDLLLGPVSIDRLSEDQLLLHWPPAPASTIGPALASTLGPCQCRCA